MKYCSLCNGVTGDMGFSRIYPTSVSWSSNRHLRKSGASPLFPLCFDSLVLYELRQLGRHFSIWYQRVGGSMTLVSHVQLKRLVNLKVLSTLVSSAKW